MTYGFHSAFTLNCSNASLHVISIVRQRDSTSMEIASQVHKSPCLFDLCIVGACFQDFPRQVKCTLYSTLISPPGKNIQLVGSTGSNESKSFSGG